MKRKQKIRKKRWEFFGALTLITAFVIFYSWGQVHYQRKRQVDRTLVTLKNPRQPLAGDVQTTDPEMKVTNAALKPLQIYFHHHWQAFQRLRKSLRDDRDGGQLRLVQAGHYDLFFPRYVLQVHAYHPQVETNHPDSRLSVNGHLRGQLVGAGQDFYRNLGPLFPGRYHLLVQTTVAGRNLKDDSMVNIWSSKTIKMTIKTGTFQIQSIPRGMIYLDDYPVKHLDQRGLAVFKDYPLAKHLELYIETPYHGHLLKSETVHDLGSRISAVAGDNDDNITAYDNVPAFKGNRHRDVYQDAEGDYIVHPNWSGLISESEAKKILQKDLLHPAASSFVRGRKNPAFKKLQRLHGRLKPKKKDDVKTQVKQLLPANKKGSVLAFRYLLRQQHHQKNSSWRQIIFRQHGQRQLIVRLANK